MTQPPQSKSSEFVQLREGPLVLASAIALALELENRGFTMRCQNGKLLLSKSATAVPDLTNLDRKAIQSLKTHLLVVVDYSVEQTGSFAQMQQQHVCNDATKATNTP
jgi:hypothetical protein